MPRYLKYRDSWESCYYSTYGREKAMRYAEQMYCQCGVRFYLHNNQVVVAAGKCNDWQGVGPGGCKGKKSGRKQPPLGKSSNGTTMAT